MDIARFSINRPIYTWIVILTCLLGGIWGFSSLGRLEDPAFTIKMAVVVTQYPGATAQEVATEVSEPIESAIQKMGEVKRIETMNQPGLSWITVEMQDTYDGTELPAIWTKLRNRVGEAALPSGSTEPFINDSFGDVYGLYYAVTAPGFSDSEVNDLADFLRREVLSVDGVADAVISGQPNERIYVEPDLALTNSLGISPGIMQAAIATADEIVDAPDGAGGGDPHSRLDALDAELAAALAGAPLPGSRPEVLAVAETARRHDLDASLFRDLATLRRDLPVFDNVDELHWTGPRPAFFEFCARANVSEYPSRGQAAAERAGS